MKLKTMLKWAVTLIALGLVMIVSAIKAEQPTTTIASNAPSQPPLPEPFDGLVKTNPYPFGVTPVAIYRSRPKKQGGIEINYALMGVLFQTDSNSFSVIVPEHLFTPDATNANFNNEYAIRTVRTRGNRIIGYINEVKSSSTDWFGCDVAIATVGSRPVSIPSFSKIQSMHEFNFTSSTNPIIRNEHVTKLRSMITGQEVTILGSGYGSKDQDINHPFLAVDMHSEEGYSGYPFFDEHNRLFILQGGMNEKMWVYQELADRFMKECGLKIKGVAILTGPIILEDP